MPMQYLTNLPNQGQAGLLGVVVSRVLPQDYETACDCVIQRDESEADAHLSVGTPSQIS